MEVVFYNGEFIDNKKISISYYDRAINYGDGFFETIKIINTNLINFSYHIERIQLALSILKMKNNYSKSLLENNVSEIVKINRIKDGSVKIIFTRSGYGRYLPKSNQTNIFIKAISGDSYILNKTVSLCFYEDEKKSLGAISNIKSINSLVSVLASIHANEKHYNNAILLNTLGHVIEATNANIFMVKNNRIFTPPITEGCVDGTMRKWICNNIIISEKNILKQDILDANEVFITNSTNGVIPIKSIEKTYFKSFNYANLIQKRIINSCLDL